MTTVVVITATIAEADRDAFEAAYLTVTEAVKGTPGHVRDSLLRDDADNGAYVLLAEWTSKELFLAWADDPGHIRQSAPMFRYWAGTFVRRIYDLRATLDSYGLPVAARSPFSERLSR